MKRTTIFFLIVTLLISCDNAELDYSKSPIDSKILIELRESLGKGPNTLSLYCETEKSYPDLCYSIKTELDFKNQSMKINFVEVITETGSACLAAIGPADARINLSTLENGSYDIELNNGNFQNEGTLIVTDATIQLQVKNENGIKIINPILQRIPSNTYWGNIGYSSQSSINKVNEFLEKLTQMGASFNKQTPGTYYHYEIDKDGNIIEPDNLGYYFLKGFIFQYTDNEDTFKESIKELVKSYDELSIRVHTYKGDSFYNNNWASDH